jgi:hypothetical protein
VAGFALVAYPADYGISGIMTFVINQWGKVYQKDLGDDTARIGVAMTEYNPDRTWVLVRDKGALPRNRQKRGGAPLARPSRK